MPDRQLTPVRLASLLSAFTLSALTVFVSLSACTKQPVSEPKLASRAGSGSEAVKSNYPSKVEATAAAREICAAFQSLPRERKAECCQQRKPSLLLTAECTRVVSGAIRSGALTVDDDRAARCAADLSAQYERCDFVGDYTRATPASCAGLLEGQLEAGATCRSSLECGAGLRCEGVSPTDLGTCAPPGAAGAACGRGIDPVAAYLGQDVLDDHPECAGFCANQRCRDHAGLGERCVSDEHCGDAAICVKSGSDEKICQAGAREAPPARPLEERCAPRG